MVSASATMVRSFRQPKILPFLPTLLCEKNGLRRSAMNISAARTMMIGSTTGTTARDNPPSKILLKWREYSECPEP